MEAFIEDSRNVRWVIFHEDGTASVGYSKMEMNEKGKMIETVVTKLTTLHDAHNQAKILKEQEAKRTKEQIKIMNASGGPPPDYKREYKQLIAPNGKAITMDQVMKTKKRRFA